MLLKNIVLPGRMVNMLCCFSATERCGRELGGVSPYKVKSFNLIRTYSTHFSATSFCSEETT